MLQLCKTTKKPQKMNTYHLCSLLMISHFFQNLRQLSLQDKKKKKENENKAEGIFGV